MNKTLAASPTKLLAYAQQLTSTQLFPISQETSAEPQNSINPLSVPFTIYEHELISSSPQPVGWLWEKRLPLSGITLLDGDHGLGKSFLALQIAAAVSRGTSLPDGTPTLQGGVVIVTPHTDATTTQLQLLTTLGADLSQIEILTYIQEPAPSPQTADARPFSLPEDFPRLFQAIQRVNARLVILDPFISLLSRERRWTELRLSHLLADLNQRLIERNVACLLIRNCTAKGGHARPPILERSDFFLITAVSRLLLTPDPMQPDHLLLCHAFSRHAALRPTLILQIKPPHISMLGSHQLLARDFIENRPDTLHRRLLFQHLQAIIADTTDPIHVSTLYTQSPHSSPFQIQRTLNDLLRMGQIERPARGFYAKASANPVFPPATASQTSPEPEFGTEAYWEWMAREAVTKLKAENKARAAEAEDFSGPPKVSRFWTHVERLLLEDEVEQQALTPEQIHALDETPVTDLISEWGDEDDIDLFSVINPTLDPTSPPDEIAATTAPEEPTNELDSSATTNTIPEPTDELASSTATTPIPEWKKQFDEYMTRNMAPEITKDFDETALKQRAQWLERCWIQTHKDEDRSPEAIAWRDRFFWRNC